MTFRHHRHRDATLSLVDAETAPAPAASPTTEERPQRVGYGPAARHLGMKLGTLRSRVSRGEVPHFRVGKRLVIFDLDDLDRWLDSKRRGA